MRLQEVVLSQFKVTPNDAYGRNKHFDFGWRTQPFVMAFCYTPNGNFVVKGMEEEVKEYVLKTYPKVLMNLCTFGPRGHGFPMWEIYENGQRKAQGYRTKINKESKNKLGRPRSRFYDDYLTEERQKTKTVFKFSSIYKHGKPTRDLVLRRLPKKWIPEFDTLIN